MNAAASASLVRSVQARVRRAMEAAGLDLARGPLVAAVSGGPDSLTLLHTLWALSDTLGFRVHVAHLDHALRGRQGAADARFVQALAQRMGLDATVERRDVRAYRAGRRGLSLETAAREVRYCFLAEVARGAGALAVALGHTADDQAETVLLHLVRGTGLSGLRGMAPIGGWPMASGPDVPLLRPLLDVWRSETAAYCQAVGLEPRVDPSNRSPRFTRSRLRRDILPRLEALNPGIKQALLRLARSAACDLDFLEGVVNQAWPNVAEPCDGGLLLHRAALAQLHGAVQAHLLRRAYAEARGTILELGQTHVEMAMDLVRGPAGRRLHLPGGLVLSAGYDTFYLGPEEGEPCPYPPLRGTQPLTIPGETELAGWRVTARRLAPQEPTPSPHPWLAVLDAQEAGASLRIRSWRPGDRMQPLGMAGTKKLQDLLTDAKVPRPWRSHIPVVESPRGIVWVVGVRVAEWAVPREAATSRLSLEFRLVSHDSRAAQATFVDPVVGPEV